MKIEYGLTDAVYGFIFMTDAARQRCSKGSAAQSCSRAAAAVQRACPGRHRVGARVFDLPSASPSLHPRNYSIELNIQTENGDPPLVTAVNESQVERIQHLLKQACVDPNAKSAEFGYAALELAARRG